MARLDLPLSVDLQHYVDTRVAAEGYHDSSDFVRDAVERDRMVYEADVRRVQSLIDEGLASGIVDAEPEDILAEILADISRSRG